MDLRKLTQAMGVSGYERRIGQLIAEDIKPYADEISVDALGNIIALKKGTGENKITIMASSHMDEIGFSVTYITEKGFLKVRPLGGHSAFTVYMNRIRFKNGVVGLIGCSESMDSIKAGDINKLYVDIGCSSKEEAEKLVKVGDYACFEGEYEELPGNRVSSKALDDRIGCYVAMECLRRMGTPYNDVYFVFSVQEELGLRGARVASNRVKPDIGIALDVTIAFDTPDTTGKGNAALGHGASIKVMDNSVVCDEYLVEEMVKCAQENDIKYHLDVLPAGGTDAGAMNQSNDGVRVSGISIPERYCHSPYGMVDMNDVEACVSLLEKYVNREFTL
jgi:endoglucanase